MSAVSYVEKLILQRVVHDALAQGFSLSVFDGEEFTVKKSTDFETVFNALRTTDIDHLTLYHPNRQPAGTIVFVYGNDGWDVISDYHVSLERFLGPINDWIQKTFEN